MTPSETRDVAAAEHQRNAQNCENGWDECDHSKLTPLQAKQTADAEHQRNLSACKDGQETCDYAKLTPPKPRRWPTPSTSEITRLA